MKHYSFCWCLFLILSASFFYFVNAQPQSESTPIDLLEFRDLPLSEFVRIFSVQTGINVVPSQEAAKVKISILVRNVTPEDAIDVLCKTHQLWYKLEKNGIYRIHTLKEYQQDLLTYQEEKTEIFTFLYPNATDVAQAIADIYGDRVELSFGNDDEDMLEELEGRYERFDLLEDRSEGLGTFDSSSTSGTSSSSSTSTRGSSTRDRDRTTDRDLRRASDRNSASNRSSGSRGTSSQNQNRTGRTTRSGQVQQGTTYQRERYEGLTTEEAQLIQDAMAGKKVNQTLLNSLLARRRAIIYVTVIRRQNRVIVRTGDEKALDQIRDMAKKLDIPTPMVLMEVKIMQVTLGDGFDSVFDFSFKDGFYSGGFTEGDFGLPPDGSFLPGGTGIRPDNLLFQYVSASFAARMQLLESKNRVTTLATPLLLTANREVSRIFAGDTLPIVTGFTESQTITTENSGNVIIVPGTPITARQDIGTSLLITPSINADRTVTLQILQETSEVNKNGAVIPIPSATGAVTEQNIDTIRRRTLAGTIMAKDGLAVAVGGLIEESVGESIEQTPLLGEIPLLGMLFRREERTKLRQELIIMIRPYVLSTVEDSEKNSQQLLEELSIHPNIPKMRGSLNTYRPEDVRKGDAPISDLHRYFKFHTTED